MYFSMSATAKQQCQNYDQIQGFQVKSGHLYVGRVALLHQAGINGFCGEYDHTTVNFLFSFLNWNATPTIWFLGISPFL